MDITQAFRHSLPVGRANNEQDT